LITIVHGGPEWSWWLGWQASWHDWGQILASNGYAVLLPNPRGSDGYGWKFVGQNRNDWGGGDYNDIMSGIDFLIKEGIADPQRLGIAGWSYGGYLTAWSITQTNRFKAAVMGAAIPNLVSFYGITHAPSVFDAYFNGNLYARKKDYIDRSPINYIRNIKTPTLILHGENDQGVPVSQTKEFYRGIRAMGVESKAVIYPREGHAFKERGHQIDSLKRILDWFDKYLK
jgi:dipeptidyl aminopeptidase/acylaminoacyl peptidase